MMLKWSAGEEILRLAIRRKTKCGQSANEQHEIWERASMFRVIEAGNADKLWQTIALSLQHGEGLRQQSRNGPVRELLHAALSISDPRQRWVLSRQPALNPAFAIAEVIWIVNGRNDSAFLNYFNGELPKYAGDGATYHGAYGFRLRHHLGIDQLQRAYDVLRQDGDCRQVVLQIWDATIDIPNDDAKPRSRDIPCNVMSLLKVRNGCLEWTQIMRSNDVFLGLPHNIVQFTSLQEVVAGWLSLGIGSYNQISDSLHLYDKDAASLDFSTSTGMVQNTDDLMLDKSTSESIFLEAARKTERVIDSSVGPSEVEELAKWPSAPAAYQNMMCIICAEGARRRKTLDLAAQIVAKCTNPILVTLWNNWVDRWSKIKTAEVRDGLI